MTQDEIIEMARQAASHGVEDHRSGEVSYVFYNEHLTNFAKLVAQHTLSNIDPSKFMSYQEGMDAGRLAERTKLQGQIETLHAMYELASKQRDYLMEQQNAQVAAMRGKMQ